MLPLLATQILWINLITDAGPALAMGVDPIGGTVPLAPGRWLVCVALASGVLWFSELRKAGLRAWARLT